MISFVYRNHRSEVALRTVELVALEYNTRPHNTYGYQPGWALLCKDYTDGREGVGRTFYLSNIVMPEAAFVNGRSPAFSLPVGERSLSAKPAKQTSSEVSSLAAKYLGMSEHQLRAMAGSENLDFLLEDLKTLAASALAYD